MTMTFDKSDDQAQVRALAQVKPEDLTTMDVEQLTALGRQLEQRARQLEEQQGTLPAPEAQP
ncbi:hypothetical protein [Deinococcus multiflagellatus]|uniref:Uncharacterized protein n=1 Tax=Deinococcus multiflagellatus TaxID=1656887 RepID=A0ABW1ZKP8_9DEIO|nr:hypothetical protein [Deinococcus multiflagellatus]MBZ9713762.1 hypothetical protein [Deinococcus multiflagellatus]